MRPFLATLKIRAAVEVQYRSAAIAGMVTQLFFGLVLVFLYQALYENAPSSSVPDLPQILTYVWLQQIFFRLVNGGDNEMIEAARSGNLACDLCRPVDLYGYAVARDMAGRVVACAMRALPFIAAIVLLPPSIRLQPPASALGFAAFAASLLAGLFVVSSFQTIALGVTLRTLEVNGVRSIALILLSLFTGNLIPLDLMPDGLLAVVRVLPFSQIVDTPIRFYTGQLAPSAFPGALALQLAWAVALLVTGQLIWRANIRKWVAQGG